MSKQARKSEAEHPLLLGRDFDAWVWKADDGRGDLETVESLVPADYVPTGTPFVGARGKWVRVKFVEK